jgi:adenylosuccinate synthase
MLAISKANAVVSMGVTRAYLTRHGNGPLPTEDKALTEVVNDKGNPWNAWQGNFRAGWLDVSLLKYASEVVGGKLDCIAVNCIDHLEKTSPKMAICNYGDYKYNSHRYRLSHSELESKLLETRVNPPLTDVTAEDVVREIEKIAPVAIRSYGPTFKDREISDSAKWLRKS